MINRLESDLAESPVMAQVARDFVSLDGKQVLILACSKPYVTVGRVWSSSRNARRAGAGASGSSSAQV